jgi:hypothetical protein
MNRSAQTFLLGAAIALSILALTGCSTIAGKTPAAEIQDELSADEFRAYGQSSPVVVDTRIGELKFSEGGFAGGYPTQKTVDKLFDEMDFQRGTQAYLWALPLVSYAEWLSAHEEEFKAKDGQIVQYNTLLSKQGILTANATTPYAILFADLTRTGPLVFEVPEGPSAGIINDMWQRTVIDFGVSGPDAGKGIKFLILAPGMEKPDDLDEDEFTVLDNHTNVVFFGIRALQPDPAEADAMLNKFRAYPYVDRKSPPALESLVVGDDVPWGQWQPHGMAYWKSLKEIVDREVFPQRDRFMLAMLESLGLEKGKPFKPDERQQLLLKEAAVVGEAMAKANSFTGGRFSNAEVYKGTHWDQLMVVAHDDRDEYFDQLYRRAAFTFEAVSRGKAYYIEQPGIGQQYRTGYQDSDGNPLVGSKHYSLTMPPNPPAETFWSIVVYDVNTRTPIFNSTSIPAASSRTGVKADADGSVTLHLSPTLPKGVAKENWIETNAGQSWFAYLRFYGPTEAYFNESYPLQDIKVVE